MIANTTNSASRRSTDRWENEGGPIARRHMAAQDEVQHELKRYGIVPVVLTVFDWGAIATPVQGTRLLRQNDRQTRPAPG